MRLKDLLRILLVNCLFANAVNLIFLTDLGQGIWQNWHYALLLGLGVYGIQALLLHWLIKPYRVILAVKKSLSLKPFAVGLSVAGMVWVIAQLAAAVLSNEPVVYPTESRLFRFLIIFVFNTMIGAFFEEVVFRFIPVQFCRQANLNTVQTVLVLLGVCMFFTVTHLSAYLFRDQVSMGQIGNALLLPFLCGFLFLLVYLGTKNIYFVTLIHAFGNNGLYLVETPYAIGTVLLVTLLWFIVNQRAKTRRLAPDSVRINQSS